MTDTRGDFTNHNGELERMKEEELNCKNVLNIMIVNVTLIQPIHSNTLYHQSTTTTYLPTQERGASPSTARNLPMRTLH